MKQGGVVPQGLRPMSWESLSDYTPIPAKVSLFNVQSLSIKTFILNDFFTDRGLDFLLVTETWLNTGELAPLVELSPDDCKLFSMPRLTGRGGVCLRNILMAVY